MRDHCGHGGRGHARKWAAMAATGHRQAAGAGLGAGGPWGGNWGGWGGSDAGEFGPGRGGPRRPGGPRGKRRMFDRGELRLVLLKLIAEQPRHGYDLIKALEEQSGGHYSPSPGVIYPALAMLADEALIAEQATEDQRRQFAITGAGKALLEEEAEQVEAAFARLAELSERSERHRAPSIERAAANLFMALTQRMRGERDEDLPHRIAEILDEAARRIERL